MYPIGPLLLHVSNQPTNFTVLLMFLRPYLSISHTFHFHPSILFPFLKPLNPKPTTTLFSTLKSQTFHSSLVSSSKMSDTQKPKFSIPRLDKASKPEILRALEFSLGSPFGTDPVLPPGNPLVVVISGPSGVGKDAVIKKLREERRDLHFVVTATSRPMRPGEVDGKDYYFVSKDEFVSMVKNDELLEYALVYGYYKGIPKMQIREKLASGCDVVLRVDIQGAATLRKILGKSAVFVFLVAESELKLVERLIDRKTESADDLLVRISMAKEEMKHVDNFDYVVVNAEGKLDDAVSLVGSIIDAEKAKVVPRKAVI